jgi:hypothetical protein
VAAGGGGLATLQQQALPQGKMRLACSYSKYSNKHSRACSQQMHTSQQQQQQQQLSLLVVRRLPRGHVQMVKARQATRQQPGCPVVQNRQEQQLQQQQHLVLPPQQLRMLQLLLVIVETQHQQQQLAPQWMILMGCMLQTHLQLQLLLLLMWGHPLPYSVQAAAEVMRPILQSCQLSKNQPSMCSSSGWVLLGWLQLTLLLSRAIGRSWTLLARATWPR